MVIKCLIDKIKCKINIMGLLKRSVCIYSLLESRELI